MSFARLFFTAAACATLAPLSAFAQTPAPAPTPAPAAASASASSDNAPVTRAELPDMVKKVLMDNPEIIMLAAQKLHDKQAADEDKQSKESMVKHKADLLDDSGSPSVGPKNADVTVVEFFDYHCGYCKHMVPAINQLLKEDKKVRIVFKEFPILSQDSVAASHAALAVYHVAPDKYFDYYVKLMQTTGKFDEKTLLAAAKEVGADPAKVKAEMGKEYISAELDKNRAIGEDMGIHGTPALVIGDQLVGGALPYDDLKKVVEGEHGSNKSRKAPASAN